MKTAHAAERAAADAPARGAGRARGGRRARGGSGGGGALAQRRLGRDGALRPSF